MRFSILLLLGFWACQLVAQTPPPPPDLQPLQDVTPPPSNADSQPPAEPQITIRKQGQNTVEEYRLHGKLYMMKITPSHGKSYYLIDHKGDGKWSRTESLDTGLSVPQWVIHEF